MLDSRAARAAMCSNAQEISPRSGVEVIYVTKLIEPINYARRLAEVLTGYRTCL